jgi:hypothetical protein
VLPRLVAGEEEEEEERGAEDGTVANGSGKTTDPAPIFFHAVT